MATKYRRGRPVDPKSKLSRARALFKRNVPRKDMIAKFRQKLRISAACASTYLQLCRAG